MHVSRIQKAVFRRCGAHLMPTPRAISTAPPKFCKTEAVKFLRIRIYLPIYVDGTERSRYNLSVGMVMPLGNVNEPNPSRINPT